jgi:hypothetical protein
MSSSRSFGFSLRLRVLWFLAVTSLLLSLGLWTFSSGCCLGGGPGVVFVVGLEVFDTAVLFVADPGVSDTAVVFVAVVSAGDIPEPPASADIHVPLLLTSCLFCGGGGR